MVAVGLPFHLISIFILGTPNNYWTRTVPVSNTWGQHFEHMYFVLGRNGAWRSIKKKCHKKDLLSDIEHYTCLPGLTNAPMKRDPSSTRPQNHPISLLYSAKCSDKYFGASPTCKLEKAMIYYLHSPRMAAVEWFIFMDDDNYVQPHALSSFLYARGLSTIHLSYRHGMEGMLLQNSSDVINPGASAGAHEVQTRHAESFVGCGIKYVGAFFSKDKPGANECKNLPKFCWAQPAIINREAMTILQPAVEFLMLTRLQKIWGNSHDVILGMLLWMHDLPTIPLHSVMHYCPINQHLLARGVLQADPLCSRVLVYHKVQNRKDIISQDDMVKLLQNISQREVAAAVITAAAAASAIDLERAAGVGMSENIDRLITEANRDPPKNGLYNMYWHGGRVHSMARDFYKYTVLRKGQPLRPFVFSDCGLKPKEMRFEISFVCSQSYRSVGRCCTDKECQRKHMSQPFPAIKGVNNF